MKTNTINIRPATLDDLPILLDFEQKIIETERPLDPTLKDQEKINYYNLETYITDKNTKVLIAEIGNKIVGSGFGQIRNRKNFFKQQQLGYIGFLYVKEEFRGLGINQKVIKSLCDWFKSLHIEEIRLNVYSKNARAIRAYEKAGFTQHIIQMRVDLSDID